MSQDTIVTNFTTAVTTEAAALVITLADYGKTLTDLLYDIDTLDSDHRAAIRTTSKATLIHLRGRMEILSRTIALSLQAPDI